ncbi:hypothetical protein ACIQZO_22135 [Streptomyces sp. NPDC097617]|uniref:hypothetical protein n=1 Tax=Streptomyces sp. NPDC097617 TaxID=3366091 RepID=UPI00380B6BDB
MSRPRPGTEESGGARGPAEATADPTALIDDVNSRIVQALSGHDAAELHAAAARTGIDVGETYAGRLWTGGVCPLVRRYPTGEALMAALTNGSPDALNAAIEVLAVVAPTAAMSFALEVMRIDLGGFTFGHDRVPFELVMRGRAEKIIKREPSFASPEILLDMLRRRSLAPGEIPKGKFAGIPVSALIACVSAGELRFDQAESAGLFSEHPALREGAGLLDALLKTHWFAAADGHDGDLAQWLAHRLAAAGYTPAVPALRELFTRQRRFLTSAGRNLLEIGTPEALEAAASPLSLEGVPINEYDRHDRQTTAIDALLRAGASRAFEVLAPLFEEQVLGSGDIRSESARTVLEKLTPAQAAAEPRWIERCLMAAHDRELGVTARALLDQLGPGLVDEAAARVKKRRRMAAARSTVKAPAGHLVERYRAGEHERVWEELLALDRKPPKALAAQAEAVAMETMERVRCGVEAVVARLRAEAYPFHKEARALVPPPLDALRSVKRLESLTGGRRLPLSLRAFYLVVGSVDLSGRADSFRHAPDRHGLKPKQGEIVNVPEKYPFMYLSHFDPLVILPLEEAVAEAETWARKERARVGMQAPLDLAISPGPSFKANPGDAQPEPVDTVRLPGPYADVELRRGRGGAVPFVEHLRGCLAWGGFPGLAGTSVRPQAALDALAQSVAPF